MPGSYLSLVTETARSVATTPTAKGWPSWGHFPAPNPLKSVTYVENTEQREGNGDAGRGNGGDGDDGSDVAADGGAAGGGDGNSGGNGDDDGKIGSGWHIDDGAKNAVSTMLVLCLV